MPKLASKVDVEGRKKEDKGRKNRWCLNEDMVEAMFDWISEIRAGLMS